jgi:hypothetical protein
MTGGNAWEKDAARVTSEVARRAIRRLDFLEWVILAVAVGLAIAGGALVAWILAGTASTNFRMIWIVTSAVLFIVPGIVVFVKTRWDQRRKATGSGEARSEDG